MCFLAPTLHIVSFLIRVAFQLFMKWVLPEKHELRRDIDLQLGAAGRQTATGHCVASCRTLRELMSRFGQRLYVVAQESGQPRTRFHGLLLHAVSRLVKAIYGPTATLDLLEISFSALVEFLTLTDLSASRGGLKPDVVGTPKALKYAGGVKLHSQNTYVHSMMTLLVPTAKLALAIGVPMVAINEEEGERMLGRHSANVQVPLPHLRV